MRRASRVCFASSYRGKVDVICTLHFSVSFRFLFLVFKLFCFLLKSIYVPPTFISKNNHIVGVERYSVTPILRPASRTEYIGKMRFQLAGRRKSENTRILIGLGKDQCVDVVYR